MTWREKLGKMALIDILYMLDEHIDSVYDEYDEYEPAFLCARDVITGKYTGLPCSYEWECRECLEKLLNEEVRQDSQNKQLS